MNSFILFSCRSLLLVVSQTARFRIPGWQELLNSIILLLVRSILPATTWLLALVIVVPYSVTMCRFLTLSLLAPIAALAVTLDPAQPRFGSRFCMFNTTSWIRVINTTLVIPPVPSPPTDELALWPGIEVPHGGLTQSLIRSFKDPGYGCSPSFQGVHSADRC